MSDNLTEAYNAFRSTDHSVPRVFSLENNSRHLTYVGVKHSNNPNDPQYEIIRNTFQKFLSKLSQSPSLVLTEGGIRKVDSAASPDEVIREQGEMGYLTLIAQKSNIQVESPEPSGRLWFEGLIERFRREDVVYYDFARIAHQWNRAVTKRDFQEYVQQFFERNIQETGWDADVFSLDAVMETHNRLFQAPFDENDDSFLQSILDPNSQKSVINKISQFDDTGYRDQLILQNIRKFWSEGYDLFIIYGMQHAFLQEQALREMVKGYTEHSTAIS